MDYVCSVNDLASGSMKTFVVSGKRITLAHVDGEFFAVDDACTHKQCSLGTEGALDGSVIICGCHGAQFDVTSGKVLAPPAVSNVQSYEVKVEHGGVYVRF
jgi:nitrite reductase/ring-hydroxylating ferredoxin subunit